MSNIISATFNPVQYAERLAVEEIRNELDIAAEIFVVQNRGIHYADIMESKEGEASRTMLLSWLNDSVRRGVTARDGIVTLYKASHPDHFENGKWRAQYLAAFIDYALRQLTEKTFMKDKRRAALFSESVKSEEWAWQAASVMSIKLFEDLYLQNGLRSLSARFAIGEMIRYREMWEKLGGLVGRVGKTGGLDDFTRQQLKSEFQSGLREAMKQHTSMLSQTKEYVLFEKHAPAIKGMLRTALQENTRLIA